MFSARVTINTLVFILPLILVTKCEMYGSLTSLTATEQTFVKHIQEYQQKRLNELENLQRKIETIQLEHDEAIEDAVDYLSNPFNAYRLIKRIVIDWNEIHDFIKFGNTTIDLGKELTSRMGNLELPTRVHLGEAVFYLDSYIHGSKMTWDDCYEIGILLYDKQDFTGAIPWLERSLDKMKDADNTNELIRIDVVEYIAYCKYLLGLPEEATLTMERVLGTPVVNSIFDDLRAYLMLDAASIIAS